MKADGSSDNELRIRLSTATSAMVKLGIIWQNKKMSFHTKYKLYKSLILSILLYGCETWTLMKKEEKRIQAFQNKAHRRLLCITYRQRKTNDYIHEKMTNLIGKYEPLLSTIKRRKLKYYGHICRHDGLAKTILQGKVEGKRKRGRPRNNWMHNVNNWTNKNTSELTRMVEDREEWKNFVNATCLMIPPTIQESRE